jgi:protease I
MATILIPLPNTDFDPTESAVPWRVLTTAGHTVVFATPDGEPGAADPIMVTGKGLGLLAPLLMADANGRAAYAAMQASAAFQKPLRYADLRCANFDALLLPGGHAPGMRPYLESAALQTLVVEFFASSKPVAAICHGVLLAARSRKANGQSVLHGRKTTALTKMLELSGWALTCAWMGSYYRTYPQVLQDEVCGTLAQPGDFVPGPTATTRDSPSNLAPGFVVQDGNYLSARWPGDAHRFAAEFATMLAA